jgi:conjugative relaxase-like TrwC/TraI family protein
MTPLNLTTSLSESHFISAHCPLLRYTHYHIIFDQESNAPGVRSLAQRGAREVARVVLDVAKLTPGREDYYLSRLADNREEYLSGHGESPGRWHGQGAASLGLDGEASKDGFRRLIQGRHPETGELLGRKHGRNAVTGFDLVLRPSKSVSVLYGLGDTATGQAVLDAHHIGLVEATAYLDGQLGARRGHGGAEHVGGGGLLAVGFDHRTSREGDPLVHTHLVVANRVQGPDGRWTALNGRDVYRHRRAADAIYRAALQRELTRSLGVAWTDADRHGNREIRGMPTELVRAFSKRAEQVNAEVERLEASGRLRTPRLVKWAVHATRKAKQHETPETLYARWRQEAGERGTDPDALVRAVTGRARERDQGPSEAQVARVFDRLAGPEGLTGQASTFACEDVLVALGGGLVGATRQELEGLASRFLAERAVSVVADRALEERRWTTPELLNVEERLVAAAASRTGERAGLVAPEAVREALAAHPTLGADQAGMVRDACLDGAGVRVVVGRPGTGKTYTLGVAKHAWQLGGYRVLAAAPTGIATVSLEAEGFEEVATVDRLLGELDRNHRPGHGRGDGPLLDARTVLVVDEAGMVGSRKLARLLEHAQRDGAKVVLVGDDRQLAAIDAGGAFRALRLRLGASELVENRRQLHAWQREAIELVRQGEVDQAVDLYQAHDRVVAAESKQELALALLTDWWAAYQDTERDPDQDVVVLAARRDEVDRLNTYCQQVLAKHGRLGTDRLKVEDREVAVGDRVVCGKNALDRLGIANGSRGLVVGLDPNARTLTVRLDGSEREVALPRSYLDGRTSQEHNRRVDLAYATTGHRAQGLTKWRALVRVTGGEDVNWFNVQLSRARQDTRLYAVVGPEPHDDAGELDLPDLERGDALAQIGRAMRKDGSQYLAIDTTSTPDPRHLSTRELRAERDRLAGRLAEAPRDRARELARAKDRREQAEAELAARREQQTMLRQQGRAQQRVSVQAGAEAVTAQQTDRATRREQELRAHQQRRAGWFEEHAPLVGAYRQVVRTLAWQRRARGLACEAIDQDRPGYLRDALGPAPESTRRRRAWRQAAAQIEEYRTVYQVSDPERALGPIPRDPAQRADWQRAAAIEHVHHKQRVAERTRDHQPTQMASRRQQQSLARARSERDAPGRQGPERAAG